MAYQALYRTYRPQHFSGVVGQEHITKVLSGQITMSKISHAYLFAGPRGTGKTSLAKIFAAAVNCTDRNGFESCGKCEACKNGYIDTIEIDAASNNGVDSVREIRDRVNLLPALCTYKVYIIDEAHMLTKGAFNALLKTLEEPPAHVIFILATTEPHKLPPTIRSRCQKFDFRRIPVDIIVSLLENICSSESIEFEKDALYMIARAAEGGARDALSILDQCLAYGKVTIAAVSGALGGTDISQVSQLVEYISSYDEKNALEMLRSIIDSGADTRALIKSIADMFRIMMWISCGAKSESYDNLEKLAASYGKKACVRALDILIQKEFEMRQNLRADIVLETAVMSLMAPEDDKDSGCELRIEKLEQQLKKLKSEGVKFAAQNQKEDSLKPKSSKEKPTGEPPIDNPQPETAKGVKGKKENTLVASSSKYWQELLDSLREEEYFVFAQAKLAIETTIVGNTLEITLDSEDDTAAEFLKGDAAKKAILPILHKHNPDVTQIKTVLKSKPKPTNDLNVLEMFGADIEQI